METAGETTIREAEPSDWEALLAVRSRAFEAHDAERVRRRWQWQWHENPAYGRDAFGWVLECDGDVAGFFGLVPWRLSVDGRIITTVSANDYFVDPAVQSRGVGLALARRFLAVPPDGYPFATAPVPGSLKLWRYCGAQTLEGKSESCLWIGTGAASSAAPRDRVVEEIVSFPDEVDDLFVRLSGHWPVITVRDRAYLQWRYRDFPFASCDQALIRDAHGTLRGFVVVQPDAAEGRAYVTELFAAPDDTSTLKAGLAFAVAARDRRGYEHLYALHRDPNAQRALADQGFHEVQNHPLGFFAKPGAGAPPLTDFYLTAGDGDLLFGVDGG